jgi:hypothetical protein
MSTLLIGLFWSTIIAACTITLHLLDRRLVATAAREQWQARQSARVSGLSARRPQDELEGWR